LKAPAQRLAAGLVSAGLLGLTGAPAAHGQTGPLPDATSQQSTAPPPAAVLPDSAPEPAAPSAATAAPGVPVDPMAPLDLSGSKPPHATEDPAPAATPTRTRKPEAAKPAPGTNKPASKAAASGDPAAGAGPSAAVLKAMPAEAPADVPGYFIDSFRVPVFLLPIYQAAGIQYGVRWEILAAINEIETDYGRNLDVSSAGAQGWMQFMPATWQGYGVDANLDGRADPYNPVDAIFAAARYLQAAGAQADLRKALLAYNHADWYVASVLQRAQRLAALPNDLVGALTGLAQGRSPTLGKVRAVASITGSRSLNLRVTDRAAVVAVTDGTVVRIGRNARLGRFVQLRDVYGNTYTYGRLATFAKRYPVLRSAKATAAARQATLAAAPAPSAPSRPLTGRDLTAALALLKTLARDTPARGAAAAAAAPAAPVAALAGPLAAIDWGNQALALAPVPARASTPVAPPSPLTATGYDRRLLGGVASERVGYRPLREGTRVVAGTILGHAAGATAGTARLRFEIRPTGKRTPRIDPRPILAGWKLLQASSPGTPPIRTQPAAQTSVGQVLLLGKRALQQLVLANPKIAIYPCGREDIGSGRIDRRVLATLQVLATSGLSPTVSALECGHSKMTASGNVSEHWSGNAVDISAINGTPILGNQGAGSITEATIRRLLTLQGTMRPHQIISLMTFDGAANTLALADHDDHIHVGFSPLDAATSLNAKLFDGVLEPQAWKRLIDRLAAIRNPQVAPAPSAAALPALPASP
jgi:soluble lytic murein transglycosylase-like protein